MKKLIRLLTALVLAFILSLFLVTPALAISNPDSGPTIESVHVYRHTLETDDMLIVVQYYLDYTTNPSETINQAFLGRFMSADGSELANVAPYAYYDKGYDHGIFSMYLDASYVSHWETACTVRFEGNPMLDWQGLAATSAMTGAVADDGGVQTDETATANNSTANDMTLLPATPAVNDAYYFGDDRPFSKLTLNIGTSGDGAWSIVWEYWNGSEWATPSDISDYTTHFRAAAGNRNVEFTLPTNWKKTSVKNIDAYWIRARVYDYTSVTTQPKGTQSWTNVAEAPPYATTSTLNWHATSTSAATKLLLGSNIISIANTLSDYWSVALTTETAAGTLLSSYGEQYFTNAILNLRTMCPSIFSGGIVTPEYEETLYIGSATSKLTGAVADDGGVQTNETAAANNATANDMTLLPATPAVNDAYYFGDDGTFSMVTLNIGTSGVGVWSVTWEYWNGAWTALTGVTDLTVGFTADVGNRHVLFDAPYDWKQTTVESIEAYWIRARVSAYTSTTTQPLGTQCWTNVCGSYRDLLLSRWDGTMTGTALQGLSDWTTIPLTVVKGFLWFIPVGIIAYYIALSVKDLRPALFLVLLTLPMGNLLGMLSLTLTMIAALFCIIALGYAIFYRAASG